MCTNDDPVPLRSSCSSKRSLRFGQAPSATIGIAEMRRRVIPARALEELVWRDLCEVLSAPDMIAHAMERARGGHWIPQELQARQANLRRGRAALSQQVERLTEAYLAGVVPLCEYERSRRDAETRLQAVERQ